MPAQIETTWCSTGNGVYCGCLSSSTRRAPRSSCCLRRLVEVGAEGGERLELAVLREVQAQAAGDRLHRLDLRRAADAGHRDADVDGRADTGVEQVGLEEDLAVGDRDDVGRDERRDVVALGLDDRQAGHRAAAELVGQLRAALEQPGVQVEDVARVGLAARRAAQQQRDRAVGVGLLGQVVEHDEDVLALVHPVLADARAGVGREVLEAGRLGRGGRDDGRVLHRAGLLEAPDELGDGRALLADGDVDALDLLLRVAALPVLALVDDRVERDRGLAGLAVADDQLALAAADGRHGVDGLDAGLQRLVDRLALDDGGRLQLEDAAALGDDLALAVDRVAQRVDHAAEEAVADGDREDLAGAADRLALLDGAGVAEDDAADLARVEVEREAEGAALELQQLVGHGGVQALDAGDAVADLGDGAHLLAGGLRRVRRDVLLDGRPDVLRPDAELRHLGFPAFCHLLRGLVRRVLRGARRRSGPAGRGHGRCRTSVAAARMRAQHRGRAGGLAGEAPADVGEPARDAAVEHLVADPDVHAAEDGRVDVDLQGDLPAVQPGQGARRGAAPGPGRGRAPRGPRRPAAGGGPPPAATGPRARSRSSARADG